MQHLPDLFELPAPIAITVKEPSIQPRTANQLPAAGASGHNLATGVVFFFGLHGLLYALIALASNAPIAALFKQLLIAARALDRLSPPLLRRAAVGRGTLFFVLTFYGVLDLVV